MPRLGNRKSRQGCRKCKQRKVKCDEQRPICGWCRAHSLPCEYPAPFSRSSGLDQRQRNVSTISRRSSASTPPAFASIPDMTMPVHDDTPIPVGATNHSRCLLELALMQYYIARVAPTVPYLDSNKQEGLQIHMDLIPQEGLRCPCLLHAMYAYALLHMHIERTIHKRYPRNRSHFESLGLTFEDDGMTDPDQRQSVDPLSLHRDYLDRALQELQVAITNMDAQNADGICMASILIACTALVHASQVRPSYQDYTLPLEWFKLQQSYTSCLHAAGPLLAHESVTRLIGQTAPQVDNHFLASANPDEPFWTLLQWNPDTFREQLSGDEEEVYARNVAYLQALYRHVLERESWQALGRRILAFPNVATSTYVKFLEEGRPRALAILAHILAFGRRLDAAWWIFKGVSDYHIHGIARSIPDEWQWALKWPLRVLECGMDSAGPPI